MSEEMLQQIADTADMIIAGFSFTKTNDHKIRVLNLENPNEASTLDSEGQMIETTMNDDVLCLVQAYYIKNKEFMED